eukprot:12903857-Alexandrium_andersonii.AAC.1
MPCCPRCRSRGGSCRSRAPLPRRLLVSRRCAAAPRAACPVARGAASKAAPRSPPARPPLQPSPAASRTFILPDTFGVGTGAPAVIATAPPPRVRLVLPIV